MGYSTFLLYDGNWKHTDEPSLFIGNRAFRFGDAIAEDIHAFSSHPQFFDRHVRSLMEGMELLEMDVPPDFSVDVLQLYLSGLLLRNKIFGGAAVRLTVFRNSVTPLLIPEDNRTSYVMDARKLDHKYYTLNENGYIIDVFDEIHKPVNRLSGLRNAFSSLYLYAGNYCKNNRLDDCILLNDKGRMVESLCSNIFLIKDNSIFTPAVEEGCISGVLRQVMVELCISMGYRINDSSRLNPEALGDADEVFLLNAVEGIRWVAAYKNRRYYRRIVPLLNDALNEAAFSQGTS